MAAGFGPRCRQRAGLAGAEVGEVGQRAAGVEESHVAGHDALDLHGREVGQGQPGDDHVVPLVGVELLDVGLMHVHLRGRGCQVRVRGDEVAQSRGEARVGLDDVQAAAPGQPRYQGPGDRAGAGTGFQDCQRVGRLSPYGVGERAGQGLAAGGYGTRGAQITGRFDQEHPAFGIALRQDTVVGGGPVVHGIDARKPRPAWDPSFGDGVPRRK